MLISYAHNLLPLISYLEYDVAENDELLEEMIKASNIGGLDDEEGGPPLLNLIYRNQLKLKYLYLGIINN